MQESGYDEYSSNRQILLLKILILLPDWLEAYENKPGFALKSLFQYQEVQTYLKINQYQGSLYFHFESFIELLGAFNVSAILSIAFWEVSNNTLIKKKLVSWYSQINRIISLAGKNSCKVMPTIDAILEYQDMHSEKHEVDKR